MQHGHQLPLPVDLLFASQGESLDADGVGEVAEDRFDDSKPHAVDVAAEGGVDLLSHPLQRAGLFRGNLADLDVDLPGALLFDAAQAAGPLGARIAVGLVSLELHEQGAADFRLSALEPHRLAGRTEAGPVVEIDLEVFGGVATVGFGFLRGGRLVLAGAGKARIAGAEAVVGDVAVDLLLFEKLERLFVAVTAVGQNLPLLQGTLVILGEGLFELVDHRFQQTMFLALALAEGLGADDHLVFGIDRGDPDIALDHPVTGFHLGALVVGEVALHFFAGVPQALLVLLEKPVDLVAGFEQGFDLLLFALADHRVIFALAVFVPMLVQHVTHGPVDFSALLFQGLMGAAPLLGGVGGKLAAVDGEHLLADQPHFVTDQQHLMEEFADLFGGTADEVRDGREVRPGVGG